MIHEEQRASMRRLFFAEHWKVGTIAAELGVHHDTVASPSRPRASSTSSTGHRPRSSIRTRLHPLTLKDHPKLLATRLYGMITPRGYTGSVVQLRRYVRAIRPSPHQEAFLRLRTLPGEQAQVDWASFGSILIGPPRAPSRAF